MKNKLLKIICLLLLILTTFLTYSNVKAEDLDISIESIQVVEKNNSVIVNNSDFTNNTLVSDIKFNNKNDYVIFEVELKNNSENNYEVMDIIDNNESDNIEITYDFNNKIFSKENYKFKIKVLYKEKLINTSSLTLNDLMFTLNLKNDNGDISSLTINNPNTGDNIMLYLVLLTISITGIYLLIRKSIININGKKIRLGVAVLIIGLIIAPFCVLAVEKYNVYIKIKGLVFESEYLPYEITFKSNDGTNLDSRIVTYGQQIGELPTPTPIDGYIFDGWYTSQTGGIKIDSSYVVVGKTDLFARWKNSIERATISPESININVGDEQNISISDIGEDYTFQSSDENYATVDSTGKVKGIAKGNVTITITGTTSEKQRTIEVNVIIPTIVISFDSQGGSNVDDMEIEKGSKIETLPKPTRIEHIFLGWYTSTNYETQITTNTTHNQTTTYYAKWIDGTTCADNNNITIYDGVSCPNNLNVTVGDNIVCKRAKTLHQEECTQTSDHCNAAGYTVDGSKGTNMITYGSCGTSGILQSGDAFTCDVNGDGKFNEYTERFYYVSDYFNTTSKEFEDDTAVLIYYNNTSNGVACNSVRYAYSGSSNSGPIILAPHLPKTTQWTNVTLKNTSRQLLNESNTTTIYTDQTLPIYSYSGYAARLITYQEIDNACTQHYLGRGDLDPCNYILENTRYAQASVYSEGTWLETPRNTFSTRYPYVYYLDPQYRYISYEVRGGIYYVYAGARPVIEVPKTKISY